MPVFPKPRVAWEYDVATERRRLRAHKAVRGIPDRSPENLLIGTWNIANFGAQARRACDHRLIAEILGWLAISTCFVLKESPSSPSARIDVVAVPEA
jgi:hypothetical protein